MTWYPEAAATEEPGGANFAPVMSSRLMESVTSRVGRESQQFHEKMAQKLGVQTEAGRVHLRAARVYREGKARFHEDSDELGELPPKSIIAAHKAAVGFHKKAAEKTGLDTDEAHAHVAELERHLDVINKAKRQLKTSEAGVKGMKWGAKKGGEENLSPKESARSAVAEVGSGGFSQLIDNTEARGEDFAEVADNAALALDDAGEDEAAAAFRKAAEVYTDHGGKMSTRLADRVLGPLEKHVYKAKIGEAKRGKVGAREHGTERKRSGFSDRFGVNEAEELGILGMSSGGHKKALLGYPGKKKKVKSKDPEELEKGQKKKELHKQWPSRAIAAAIASSREAYLEPRQEDSHEEGTFVGPRYEKSHQAERGSQC